MTKTTTITRFVPRLSSIEVSEVITKISYLCACFGQQTEPLCRSRACRDRESHHLVLTTMPQMMHVECWGRYQATAKTCWNSGCHGYRKKLRTYWRCPFQDLQAALGARREGLCRRCHEGEDPSYYEEERKQKKKQKKKQEKEQKRKAQAQDRLFMDDDQDKQEKVLSRATLVVCNVTLVGQWAGEAQARLCEKHGLRVCRECSSSAALAHCRHRYRPCC